MLRMGPWTQILVRAQGDPLALLHSVRQQVASINPDQQTEGDIRDLKGWIARMPEYARSRLVSLSFGAFSVLALILAAVGLYSVVSYSVVQRTNEFGIRMALGAQKSHVLKIVLASAGVSVGVGIISGLVLSFSLDRVIAKGVENASYNPWLILGVSYLLLAVALLACLAPARKAVEVDPMTALRCE
jgi:ABC-type antimicrobial peptide transport system permease subunit